ncbi:putative GTP-binding protein Parf [Reticulomyxa filosa]|uniref:Putative GTP-binding protein Parf n=1 Tax=Reticulomyxa filosa TaxID=46433 RepID=X6MX21_RETFI|nr:putative GTP-binding protein Parf [Reticulomyxa filosa]ETO17635.1 putative GTP-binding protein Parf [Reticulomyxa filosa]|eukprot:ETO01127.1 putative GTP-binding protein Parf [Reticulomyxa filosa]
MDTSEQKKTVCWKNDKALLHRLEGGKFKSEHIPTPQIQTAHVPWTYKTTEEMVKLEIWDVVDKAIVPEFTDDSQTTTSHISARCLPADASSVDVYKGYMINK